MGQDRQDTLQGKTALVCGATEGIGRQTALTLADRGARIIAVARNQSRLDSLLGELRSGQMHLQVTADFDRPEEAMARLMPVITPHPVSILINNAGGPPGGPLLSATPAAFEQAFSRHLIMAHCLTQAVVPSMKSASYGRIINIISTSVREPIPGLGVSNTIRGAVASWAKTLASELGPDQICVNNVLPGFTETGRLESLIDARASAGNTSGKSVADGMRAQVPFGRFGSPRELANVIVFLASPEASYISGQSLAVDGGRMRSI